MNYEIVYNLSGKLMIIYEIFAFTLENSYRTMQILSKKLLKNVNINDNDVILNIVCGEVRTANSLATADKYGKVLSFTIDN